MFWNHDPGPCPVDDAPHTTCVAPSTPISRLQPDQTVTIPLARPGFLCDRTPPAPPVVRTVVEVNTATYRRKRKA